MENKLLKRGTKLAWKESGVIAYEKDGDNEADWWRSHSVDTNKPLSERYGFKLSDEMILKHETKIFNILQP
jgi:hypothetical protein